MEEQKKTEIKNATLADVELLKPYASEEEVENFYTRLNFNFGGGIVLTSEQIESFFKNNLHLETSYDMLTLYIDTVRVLRLVGKNENEVIGLDATSVKSLHDKISSEYGGTVDVIKDSEYKKAVSPYSKLTGAYDNIKVELISSLKELNHEGSRMNHCIATYSDIIIRKQYVGFRVYNKKNGERLTLGCFRNPEDDKLYFNQLKGSGNFPAKKDSCVAIINFCKNNNITIPESELYDLRPAFY